MTREEEDRQYVVNSALDGRCFLLKLGIKPETLLLGAEAFTAVGYVRSNPLLGIEGGYLGCERLLGMDIVLVYEAHPWQVTCR